HRMRDNKAQIRQQYITTKTSLYGSFCCFTTQRFLATQFLLLLSISTVELVITVVPTSIMFMMTALSYFDCVMHEKIWRLCDVRKVTAQLAHPILSPILSAHHAAFRLPTVGAPRRIAART